MIFSRISYGATPNNIPFISVNRNVLDKFSYQPQNNFVYFNGKKLSYSLSVSQYNGQSDSSQSNSSYNIKFNDVQNIVFEGAVVKQNPYNNKQIRVVFNTIQDFISLNQEQITIINDYYKIKEITSSNKQVQYNATKKQFLICNGQKPITIKLPGQVQDMDYIKISTLDKINANNVVNIVVTRLGVYINSTNETMLTIDSPYSSVQLIYSRSTQTWLVITPFIPMQRDTVGITKQEAQRAAKKQMLIFG